MRKTPPVKPPVSEPPPAPKRPAKIPAPALAGRTSRSAPAQESSAKAVAVKAVSSKALVPQAAPMKTSVPKTVPTKVASSKTAKAIPVRAVSSAPVPVRVVAETPATYFAGTGGRAWRMSGKHAVAYVGNAVLAGELLATEPRHLAKSAMAVYYDRKGKPFAWQLRFDTARWEEVVGRLA